MFQKTKAFISLFFFLLISPFSGATWISPEDLRKDLAPDRYDSSNMTEAEFRSRIQTLQDLYAPLAKKHGGKLSISGDWKSTTLNAGANQMFGNWQVKITGALARRPELSGDGFSLILCHELGHHFAGFTIGPAQTPLMKPWAANEGQADYFSTHVCARKLWANEIANNAEFRQTATAQVRTKCDSIWFGEQDQNLCYRVLAAVQSMTQTMAAIMNKPAPDLETPDLTVVDQTSHKHPAVQCRMDTTLQGALCPAFFDSTIIPGKSTPGGVNGIEAEREAAHFSCTQFSGFDIGLRPTCWFKPRL